MDILEVKNVYKSYDSGSNRLEVLKGIDLSIKKGETVSIMGESGSGKSTFLNVLSTLDKPDSGELFLNGVEYHNLSEKEKNRIRNQSFGFIFQFHYLLEEFTVEENVALPLLIRNENFIKSLEKAKFLLETVGLKEKIGKYPSTLSGGEQQRAAVARALVHKPEIILADEPSGNLDPKNSKMLHNLIKDLNLEEHQTFIIVTHNIGFGEMCNTKYLMTEGKLKQVDEFNQF